MSVFICIDKGGYFFRRIAIQGVCHIMFICPVFPQIFSFLIGDKQILRRILLWLRGYFFLQFVDFAFIEKCPGKKIFFPPTYLDRHFIQPDTIVEKLLKRNNNLIMFFDPF